MYELIVFDLDGTLLDTLDDLQAAVNAALEKFSLPRRSKEEVCAFVGNGIVKLMQRAVGAETPDFEKILDEFKQYYAAHCADCTRPYAGVLALLADLKNCGKKLALLSNKADFAVKKLAKTYFGDVFDSVVGENEAAGIQKKPAPDSLFLIMERLGASKENTLYVGDSEVDIQTAKNADVDCLSVTWGFRNKAFLRENGARNFADTPQEALRFCTEGRVCEKRSV